MLPLSPASWKELFNHQCYVNVTVVVSSGNIQGSQVNVNRSAQSETSAVVVVTVVIHSFIQLVSQSVSQSVSWYYNTPGNSSYRF